jgi:hypothetical protein
MSDPRIDKLAQILVQYSVGAKPGQLVGIWGAPFSPQALPLMEAGGCPPNSLSAGPLY